MKWMFRTIFLILAVFIITMIVGATRSNTLVAEQSMTIDAGPYDIFPYLNDLSQHVDWSPWVSGDPDIQIVYGGPDSGLGQSMAWRSAEASIGDGSQEISESLEFAFVRADMLAHGKTGYVTYAITESDSGDTIVLMGMETSLGGFPFVQRLFSGQVESDMNTKLRGGLASLKALVESDLELDEL